MRANEIGMHPFSILESRVSSGLFNLAAKCGDLSSGLQQWRASGTEFRSTRGWGQTLNSDIFFLRKRLKIHQALP